jgi:hypothetical protein
MELRFVLHHQIKGVYRVPTEGSDVVQPSSYLHDAIRGHPVAVNDVSSSGNRRPVRQTLQHDDGVGSSWPAT